MGTSAVLTSLESAQREINEDVSISEEITEFASRTWRITKKERAGHAVPPSVVHRRAVLEVELRPGFDVPCRPNRGGNQPRGGRVGYPSSSHRCSWRLWIDADLG